MKNVRIIYRRLEQPLRKYGYINLNHKIVNNKDDLVELASIFRDTRYETFRIIYLKENYIAGYESVSTKTPTNVDIFYKYRKGRSRCERCFYKIADRKNRLQADSYYLVHNHPSDNAKASSEDLKLTQEFSKKIKGFKGHLIVNSDSYAWISIDDKGVAVAENYLKVNLKKSKKIEKRLKNKTIYDLKICNRDDFVALMHNIKNSKNYSTAILTDCFGKIRLVLDVYNNFINMKPAQLKGYFKNLARTTGASRVLFATTDNETYKRALEHYKNGTFKDCICYKNDIKEIYVYEKAELQEKDLFDGDLSKSEVSETSKSFRINETSQPYQHNNEFTEKLRVLYKEVGKKPRIIDIDDTLEAKQKLVGGLIEVVPYDDVLLICNEEGKIMNLSPNLIFDYDYIAGNCFLIGDDYENAGFKSLSKQEIMKYKTDLEYRSFEGIRQPKNTERDNPSKRQSDMELWLFKKYRARWK